ncbi:hemolysin activation/secretion protein [Gloeomargarita lithophora Alchichica-D10]|uniref:Hemolysin activation/secretion protein n=1 Tax=Gloeomargarita lithophora Alchichica-D10 TaxID=1188229 RepID=A0A1J0AGL9_9CYAN|nr:ShlB/FhaC/HecB family hemolysin secretion/activation protein [Gloeomargarita lithophora]APB35077.1 hemolysin activation/secretion protein [Gloeomargarita lithophora Alchichica-D10]
MQTARLILTSLMIFGTAQVTIAQVGPIDPSRIQQELQPPQVPTRPEEITIPRRDDPQAPPGAADVRFILKTLNIQGVEAFSPEQVQLLYQKQLNTEISLADLYAIADKLNELYRREGYILVRVFVPEQTISQGVAQINVIEGFVEAVKFVGTTPAQEQRLRGFGEWIQRSRPLKSSALERNLLLMNDLAGYEVRARLDPGKEVGGSVLTLELTHDPFDPFFEVNNWAPDSVGPVRLQAGVFLNSLGNQGERFGFSAATTPFDFEELANGRFDFQIPIGFDGVTLSTSTSYTATRPGAEIQQFLVSGESFNFNLGLSYSLIRSRQLNVSLNGLFDLTNSTIDTRFLGPPVILSQDRIRSVRVGASVDNINALGFTAAAILLSQGLSGLGARLEGSEGAPLSRANGQATGFKVNLNVTQLFTLPQQFNFLLTGTGQVASTSLLVSEQFGLGGPSFGSAYNPSQLLGDDGYALRLELQRPVNYRAGTTPLVSQPYAFVDYGQVFLKQPTAAEPGNRELASAGLGLRQFISNYLQMRLELAFPLSKFAPQFEQTPRLLFSVQGVF